MEIFLLESFSRTLNKFHFAWTVLDLAFFSIVVQSHPRTAFPLSYVSLTWNSFGVVSLRSNLRKRGGKECSQGPRDLICIARGGKKAMEVQQSCSSPGANPVSPRD